MPPCGDPLRPLPAPRPQEFPREARGGRALCQPWLPVRMRAGGCEHPACPCAYPQFTQGGGCNNPLSHSGEARRGGSSR